MTADKWKSQALSTQQKKQRQNQRSLHGWRQMTSSQDMPVSQSSPFLPRYRDKLVSLNVYPAFSWRPSYFSIREDTQNSTFLPSIQLVYNDMQRTSTEKCVLLRLGVDRFFSYSHLRQLPHSLSSAAVFLHLVSILVAVSKDWSRWTSLAAILQTDGRI